MAHSLPFIEWSDAAHKFLVNEEGARYVSSFDSKIALVIVAGRYRSGKSFLMNQLVGDAGGFSVGHTVESKTKGIWICREAVQAQAPSGERVSMLFMDSEGLGATDKNVKHDTTIFSLAALLCSTLIFNGGSAINEESIQSLGFIANLTHHIRVRSAHGGDGSGSSAGAAGSSGGTQEDTLDDFNRFFPSFLWVLRDFGLALVDDDGSPVTADDYMESALQEQVQYFVRRVSFAAGAQALRLPLTHVSRRALIKRRFLGTGSASASRASSATATALLSFVPSKRKMRCRI
jgi:hypothetical protein